METQQLLEKSIYYWLVELVPSSVNAVIGYPGDTDLVLPTAAVKMLELTGHPFELGGKELDDHLWKIDVFANNSMQRDDLAYQIYNALENNIAVYNYNEGFPPSVSPTRTGTLVVSRRVVRPIHVFEDLVKKLYWRSSVTFYSHYELIT